MTLYWNDEPDTYVHEFGHFAFGMCDEYCENDSESAPQCGQGSEDFWAPVCPHSVMASHGALIGREFCTALNHQGFGITENGIGPQWDWVPVGSVFGFPPVLRRPLGTPNAHRYGEDIFQKDIDCP